MGKIFNFRYFTDYSKYVYNLLENNDNIVLFHRTLDTNFKIPFLFHSIDFLSKKENRVRQQFTNLRKNMEIIRRNYT